MKDFRVSLTAGVKNTNSSVIFWVSSVTFLKYWDTEFHYNTQCVSNNQSFLLGGAINCLPAAAPFGGCVPNRLIRDLHLLGFPNSKYTEVPMDKNTGSKEKG
jgi:hypothetical protein